MKCLLLRHTTRYDFPQPVRLGPHTLLLRPREGHDLRIASSALNIQPPAVITWRRDLYDNVLALASFGPGGADELIIESRVEVELYEIMPLDFVVEDHALYFPFTYRPEERTALRPYLEPLYRRHPRLDGWLEPYRSICAGSETFAVLDRMNRSIHDDLAYCERLEAGVLSPAESLRRGQGSCRDLATLFLESTRRLGIASRFVSGYLHDPARETGGASSHAWVEVYLPGGGWKGFDPTNAAVVGPDHIPVAVNRDPEAIPPVAGTFAGPNAPPPTLTVDVQVTRHGPAQVTGT